ncbi:hypothetical protein GGI04_000342 [Coemansia thaxteri]|uniref:FAD/NAD(P)-binding domain-containing protein n=1 Tax=Coemansia thaxteri TaxID=2663907 RepID=A0A9W8ELH5_9FUNG|nr:hypothetical protein H4R26_000400 [Coemansia thaxteri]KAJ2009543.1 hypothetical protein GGI04_000342 [Coemansia thaxteri]KAJ2474440.1 hypothetical protein GGI02_000062 [Coemansia sp. RSA 2322]KAJ2487720.1 hypothetical protein EV174_000391 [Coemansia sp. RSA 2320]
MSTREINVVVVGVSVAGIKAAKTIAQLSKTGYPNLRITLVDKNSYHYHAIGAPRSIVDKAYGKKLIFPLKDLLAPFELDPAHPKHTFIQASIAAVTPDSVELSTGQSVHFDYLVLSTGARNQFPANLTALNEQEAETETQRVFDNVSSAKSILVIGGGAVGVEIAGEIRAAYPDKPVTLVHSASRLLPLNFKPALSDGAVAKLQRLGVQVVLDEKIELPSDISFNCAVRPLTLRGTSGRDYVSDLQILATGTKLDTEYLAPLESKLGLVLRDPQGAIKVNSYLQLNSKGQINIFVPGDVNNLPAGAKYAYKAAQQGEHVGHNIVALIKQGASESTAKETALKEWDGSLMEIIVVPLGKHLGVFQGLGIALGKSWFGDFVTRNMKGKDYFLSQKAKEFPASSLAA